MKFFYKPEGTCSKNISFDVEGNKVRNVRFQKGCVGSLTAVSRLVEGKDIDDVIRMFSGIKCTGRNTSCPDQLAEALLGYKEQYMKGRNQ